MSGRPTGEGERGGRFTGVPDDVAGQVALVGIAVTGRDLGHGQPAEVGYGALETYDARGRLRVSPTVRWKQVVT